MMFYLKPPKSNLNGGYDSNTLLSEKDSLQAYLTEVC